MKKVHSRTRGRSPAGGFTIIELVISTTIGAMLLVAVAEVAQLFSKDLEVVSEESDWRLAECMARLADAAHRAWIVQEPEPDVLLLSDALGRKTRYVLDEDSHELIVTRRAGAPGVLLRSVKEFDVETQLVTRYREARPLDSSGVWWEQSAAAARLEALPLEEGLPVALGFTLSTRAPDWVHTVEGVTEHTLQATLEHIVIPLSFVPPVAQPASLGTSGGETEICHIPPGSPMNARSMLVPDSSLPAHRAHGDVLGTCVTVTGPDPDVADSVLFVDLYEANAPDDARPYGPVLGTISFPVNALPTGHWTWTTKRNSGASTFGGGESGNTVALCHIPPGNPDNAHTLHVSSNAVAAHLAHGDVIGSCDDASDRATTRVLVYTPPVRSVPLDLVPFNALIEPGRAHTLVFRLSGVGTVLMAGHSIGSSDHSGVAAAHIPGGRFQTLDMSIPCSLDGMRTYSQTAAHDVVNRVTVNLQMLDGETRSMTASVLSQVAVENPWLGCIPGEVPGLELTGP